MAGSVAAECVAELLRLARFFSSRKAAGERDWEEGAEKVLCADFPREGFLGKQMSSASGGYNASVKVLANEIRGLLEVCVRAL